MPNNDFKTAVISSLFWKFLERGGVSGIQLIVQILLARLLLPEDFGIIAMILVFINISQAFVNSGFGIALIQKKEVTEEDYSSVFYISLGIASLTYCILFLISPHIAGFYGQPTITPVLRVLGITLFFGAINSIQNAVIARNLQFKKLFISSLGAVLISGVVGIAMALEGFGVWALVGQQIASMAALCITMGFTVKWRPKILFSSQRVKTLFSFGWKLLASGLIDTTYNNLSSLIIGRLYPANMLGYYTRGREFPLTVTGNIDSTIQAVMFPAYAKMQDDRAAVKQIMRRALTTSAFLVFPAMAGLAAMAEPLIEILLTDKWLMSVPFVQIFCVVYALWPIHTVNLQAINALGRSDVFLRLEIVKKLVGISILAISIPFGIYAIAFGSIIGGVICTIINAYPNRELLGYSYTEQWRDLFPSLLLSIGMCVCIYGITFWGLATLATLTIQIAVGVTIYIGLAWLFRLESLGYIVGTMKEYYRGRGLY